MKDYKAISEKKSELIEHYKNKPRLTGGMSPTKEWIDWSDQKYRLEDDINALESQEVEGMTAEEMNDRAIKYGKLKQERRSGMLTDYEVSEAEIDFLRGYSAAMEASQSTVKTVSDEEIENASIEFKKHEVYKTDKFDEIEIAYQQGAIDMRDGRITE